MTEMKATKLGQRKEMQVNENEGEDTSYLRWNLQMEQSLADILREERHLGHKGDGNGAIFSRRF